MKLNNNANDNNQYARFFGIDGQLRYHWGADNEVKAVIKKREESLEISELVTRLIELARPSAKRPQWNRNLGREINILEEDERR